jgi:hypothetical protein
MCKTLFVWRPRACLHCPEHAPPFVWLLREEALQPRKCRLEQFLECYVWARVGTTGPTQIHRRCTRPVEENKLRESSGLAFHSARGGAHLRQRASSTAILSRTVTSMKLSIPKPTSEMLPAIAPATMATKPSEAFHAIVKYSSFRPRSTNAVRSETVVPAITAVYNALVFHCYGRVD